MDIIRYIDLVLLSIRIIPNEKYQKTFVRASIIDANSSERSFFSFRAGIERERVSLTFWLGKKGQEDGKLSLESPLLSPSSINFSLSDPSLASNLSRLPLPSRFRGGQTTAGFSLSPRTVGRSGSIVFACVYVGKALDISGRRPRETQFLGACSALAWSTVAGRRYLGSFTPNVETECWHNFRRRRWRAQLTPFHASATIPLSLFSCFIHGVPDQVGRKKENLNRCWKLEQNRESLGKKVSSKLIFAISRKWAKVQN